MAVRGRTPARDKVPTSSRSVGVLPFAVEQPDDTQHLNMIFYGETGTGKTRLAGTAQACPETYPALLIDVDGGTKTLSGVKIDIVRVKDWKEFQDVYTFLRHDNDRYRSVIVDSLTELQRKQSMGAVMGELGDDDDEYADLGASRPPTQQDWLRSGHQMQKVIRAMRDLSYLRNRDRRLHVMMTALEKYDDKKRVICPQLPGVLGLECGAYVDILARLSVHEVDDEEEGLVTRRHLLVTQYIDSYGVRYLSKNRGGKLGVQVWDPTIDALVSGWREGEGDTINDD